MPLEDNEHIPAKRHRHGPVATYEVFADDFDRIEDEATNVGTDLQFGIFWLSEAITSSFALPNVPRASWNVHTAFLVAMFVGYGFGLYFLVRWRKHANSLKRLMNRIRSCQVGPMGESGRELKPSELETLTNEQAPSVPPDASK